MLLFCRIKSGANVDFEAVPQLGRWGTIGQSNYKKNYSTLKLCICEDVLSNQTLAFSEKKCSIKVLVPGYYSFVKFGTKKFCFGLRKAREILLGIVAGFS